jgi:D-alanyl-D-alanine dipeptidase
MRAVGFRPYAKGWWHFELINEPSNRDGFDFEIAASPISNEKR